ncbi:hypothetical protein RhiirB3_438150 [Rhizophagus irregularis]|nr:hypothetical protein RhiirB3_438150 [Rhizophagus irregularis]
MTNNGFNMVKAEKLMNELTRFPCTAHTLQLIRVKAALYQAINHYWKVPQKQGMLATLLDSRFKELGFASNSLCLRSQEQLRMHIKI